MRKNNQSIIPKPHAYLHSMPKTSAKFQNNWRKTVRRVVPTRYPLSVHFDCISYRKKQVHKAAKVRKINLHSIQKTSEKFQNNRWKTVGGVATQGTQYIFNWTWRFHRKSIGNLIRPQGQVTPKWLIRSGRNSNSSKILCLSWLPASLTKIL